LAREGHCRVFKKGGGCARGRSVLEHTQGKHEEVMHRRRRCRDHDARGGLGVSFSTPLARCGRRESHRVPGVVPEGVAVLCLGSGPDCPMRRLARGQTRQAVLGVCAPSASAAACCLCASRPGQPNPNPNPNPGYTQPRAFSLKLKDTHHAALDTTAHPGTSVCDSQ